MHQAFNFKHQLDIAAAIQPLPGSALVRFQLRKLTLPETEHVWLECADARHIADLEIEAVGNDGDGLGDGALRLGCHIPGLRKVPHISKYRAACAQSERQMTGEG